MTVWCSIFVLIHCVNFNDNSARCLHETAAKGYVIGEMPTQYMVDFSEYAKKQGYVGDYSGKMINKDNCVKND